MTGELEVRPGRFYEQEDEAFDVTEPLTTNNCGVGSGGFQPGNTCAKGGSSVASLPNGAAVATYINGNKGPASITPLEMKKIEALNPNGLEKNTLKVPKAVGSKADTVKRLEDIMPEGVTIKSVAAGADKLGINKDTLEIDPAIAEAYKAKQKAKKAGKKAKAGTSKGLSGKPTHLFEGKTGTHPSVKEGTVFKDHEQSLPDSHLNAYKQLSPGESIAVRAWTNGKYTKVRKEVASGNVSSESVKFMSALNKLPDSNGTFYRGLKPGYSGKSNSYTVKQMKAIEAAGVGAIWSDKAPMSMTRSFGKGVSWSEGNLVFKIKSKTGKSIERASIYGDAEKEVVGMPGRNYRITGIHKNAIYRESSQFGNFDRSVNLLVEMEEV